jgi:hypothetical protein
MISHQHRVDRRAQEPLDEKRRCLIRADEIAQRSKHRALAEALALAQQSGGRRREPNALSLESVECIHLPLERGVHFVRSEQLGARRRLIACRGRSRGRRPTSSTRRRRDCASSTASRRLHLALDRGQRLGELCAILRQLSTAATVRLSRCATARGRCPRDATDLHIAMMTFRLFSAARICATDCRASSSLRCRRAAFPRPAELLFMECALTRRLPASPSTASPVRLALFASSSARWRRAIALRAVLPTTAISLRICWTCSLARARRSNSVRWASAAADCHAPLRVVRRRGRLLPLQRSRRVRTRSSSQCSSSPRASISRLASAISMVKRRAVSLNTARRVAVAARASGPALNLGMRSSSRWRSTVVSRRPWCGAVATTDAGGFLEQLTRRHVGKSASIILLSMTTPGPTQSVPRNKSECRAAARRAIEEILTSPDREAGV